MKRFLYSLLLLAIVSPCFAQDETTQKLSADKLFETDRLIEVDIELPQEEWDIIRTQTRNFVTALSKKPAERPFTWTKANVTIDGVKIDEVGLRKKGFIGSLNDDRPSLKIKLAKYVDQDPIEGITHLTLNNNNQDPGRILQYMTYKLFNESGTFAPRCSFARVTVNGDYLGIYSHVESVREPFLARGFENGEGALFEGTVTDFFPSTYKSLEPKNKAAKVKKLKKLTTALAKNEIDLDEIGELVDVDAFIKFWAMESLVGFWDGYCSNQNNYFIYQNPESDKFQFIPWGTDSSFTKNTPLPPYQIKPRSVHAKAILPNKLYRIPEVQEKYLATLESFLDKHWQEEEVLAEIDRIQEMLSDHVLESNRRFDRSLKSYKGFVKTRRRDLMRELSEGAPELPSREKMPIYFGKFGEAKLTFSTKWCDSTPRKPAEIGEATVELEIDGKTVELEDIVAYAELSKWPTQPGQAPPASIVVIGTRKSDGKKITFGTGLDRKLFEPTEEGVDIGGMLMVEGNFMGRGGGMQMLGGTVTFEKTSMTDGEEVVGEMTIDLVRMEGGKEPPGSESEDSSDKETQKSNGDEK